MRRSAALALTLMVCGMSACGSPGPAGSPEPGPSVAVPESAGSASADPALPAGWRWESYGGVEVAVPGDWGWGNGSQRLSQWCVGPTKEPMVGRPGAATLAGCPGGEPDPATLLANTGPVVGLDRTPDPDGVRDEGDQTTVRLNGVLVTVNAPAELRGRIVKTIRRVDVDSSGCPVTHPIAGDPRHRPAKPVEVTSLAEVSGVAACRFPIDDAGEGGQPRLISSLRLDGAAASRAIQAVARAPLGGGPDRPAECLPEASYGSELIVLLVTSAAGRSEVVVRYSGCDHNAFDDGVTVRSLTAEAIAPFITGPNTVLEFSGSDKMPIIQPSAK
ncbi:hypothetical protein QLQ12_10235 [Actinoplanes sp. NEAU-A12]|uniref:Uncharacterized protein n=1 Tax=Actinoplanes sandaracinus TaxID=3045177 RepID=A0ABT6WGX4_9ACTN|nr:hypothetical protein [Actinoplanes sandaracinus]MDI6098978.1 hypothetical protein [Actinoplanes sandaracinus]